MIHLFPICLSFLAGLAVSCIGKLDGTWKPTSGAFAGNALPKAMLDKMVLVIKGGTYDYDEGNGHDTGLLKEVAVSEGPFAMDIHGEEGPNKGKTIPTIYKVEGSTLEICYGLDGHRPTAFESKEKTMTMLMTYHRD